MNFTYVLESLEEKPYIWSILNHGQMSLSVRIRVKWGEILYWCSWSAQKTGNQWFKATLALAIWVGSDHLPHLLLCWFHVWPFERDATPIHFGWSNPPPNHILALFCSDSNSYKDYVLGTEVMVSLRYCAVCSFDSSGTKNRRALEKGMGLDVFFLWQVFGNFRYNKRY